MEFDLTQESYSTLVGFENAWSKWYGCCTASGKRSIFSKSQQGSSCINGMASWVFPLPLFIDCSFIWWRSGGRLSFTDLRGRYYVHYSCAETTLVLVFFDEVRQLWYWILDCSRFLFFRKTGKKWNISCHGLKTNLTRTSLPSELVSLAVKSFLLVYHLICGICQGKFRFTRVAAQTWAFSFSLVWLILFFDQT